MLCLNARISDTVTRHARTAQGNTTSFQRVRGPETQETAGRKMLSLVTQSKVYIKENPLCQQHRSCFPSPSPLAFFSTPLQFWSKSLSAVGHSGSAGDRDEYQERNKIHRRVPFTFSETQTVFSPFPRALSLHFQLPQVALGEQRKWGRGVRKLSCSPGGEQGLRHWQMSSTNTAMVSSGPATCSCILSPCHGYPHTSGGDGGESGALTREN